MGIKKAIGGTFKALDQMAGALAAIRAAEEEAEHLCRQSKAVARRQVQVAARNSDTARFTLGDLINALDKISRESNGEKADFAAELAEYAETLR